MYLNYVLPCHLIKVDVVVDIGVEGPKAINKANFIEEIRPGLAGKNQSDCRIFRILPACALKANKRQFFLFLNKWLNIFT